MANREWFYGYKKYDDGDIFVGDDRKDILIGCRKVKLKLQGGRIKTFIGVSHIPTLNNVTHEIGNRTVTYFFLVA